MKSFEVGSVLAQRDYTKRDWRGLIITAALCIAGIGYFVVRLAI